jgi:hypothetical protein
VSEYEDMVAWLEDDEGGPTDVEVWGIHKEHYGFQDLDLYLKRGGTGRSLHSLTYSDRNKCTLA